MNKEFLRKLAVNAGYRVHKRSGHSTGQTWDWGPKDPMLSRQFMSADRAWEDLFVHLKFELEKADRLMRAAKAILREDDPTLQVQLSLLDVPHRHAGCRRGHCLHAHIRHCPMQKEFV